jgi:hypothetical protein
MRKNEMEILARIKISKGSIALYMRNCKIFFGGWLAGNICEVTGSFSDFSR